jgi:L-iditol 2-dehydrogenase
LLFAPLKEDYMRAAVFQDVGKISVEEVPKPECPKDGLLVKVRACGICGTDARTFFNGDDRARPPWILGHELGVVVEEVGELARDEVDVEKGDRIHVVSTLSCGVCEYCRMGMENLCIDRGLLGYYPHPGGYAEYMPIARVALRNVMKVPDDVPLEHATLTDPFSDALNGVERLGVELGDTAVVIGAGPIGTMQAQVIRAMGAGKVILSEINKQRLKLSENVLGRDRIVYVGPDDGDLVDVVMDETDGKGAQRIIVACSSNKAQEDALRMAKKRARIVYFGGLPKTKPTINFASNYLHYGEQEVTGAYASNYKQQHLALAMIRSGTLSAEKYITHVLPLEEIAKGFEYIRSGEALKVIIRPEMD